MVVLDLLGRRVNAQDFEEVLRDLHWRAIFFYIPLLALVGGLENIQVLEQLANALRPVYTKNYGLGAGAACGTQHLPAQRRAQGLAARVLVLERAVHAGGRRGLRRPGHADLGSAHGPLRELRVMASHGRRGPAGALPGSETQKVLAQGKVPVPVCR